MVIESNSSLMPGNSANPLWCRPNRCEGLSNKKVLITVCFLLIIITCIKSVPFCAEISSESYYGNYSAAQPSIGSPASPSHLAPDSCQSCDPIGLKLIVAATTNVQTGQAEGTSSTGISEAVRAAGEMLVSGDQVRAKEILQRALRKCESGEGNTRECAEWIESLRGLERMLGKPSERTVVTNSINMKLVRIPPGEYMMGSPKRELDWLRLTFKKIWREGHKQWFQDELPLHPIRVTRPFYMGATEVTLGQFRQFVNETAHKTDAEKGDGGMVFSSKEARWVPRKEMKWDAPPWKIAENQPVVFVSWNDAQAFCRWLSRKEKRKYRLPTEAEWERCCRGGLVWARYPWGDKLPGGGDSNFGDGNPKLPESLTTVDDGYQVRSPGRQLSA